jgi:hypothetical protein
MSWRRIRGVAKLKATGRSVESGVLPCSEDVPVGGVRNSPPRYAGLLDLGLPSLVYFLVAPWILLSERDSIVVPEEAM